MLLCNCSGIHVDSLVMVKKPRVVEEERERERERVAQPMTTEGIWNHVVTFVVDP